MRFNRYSCAATVAFLLFVGVSRGVCQDNRGAEASESKPAGDTVVGEDTGESTFEAAFEAAIESSARLAPPQKSAGLKFSFRYAPWDQVLDWFATEAHLSMVLETYPTGTFNYTDTRTYTPSEAIDILNSVLLTKGYTLVRRERMLMLVNLEDGVPPNLVTRIDEKEIDQRGEYELVSCLFQLERMTPEEADTEIRKLIGPQGKVIVLERARQVLVTETAGKLRTIRDMLSAVERPADESSTASIVHLQLQHVSPEEALVVVRQIMGIEEDQFATAEGDLRLSLDPIGGRLIAKATPDAIAEVKDVLKLIDVPAPSASAESNGVVAQPQLEIYSISNADPASVLQVLQTMLAGLPDVRLALDPKTDNLIAMARPAEHATIGATLKQMQSEFAEIEVIQLSRLDPDTAKLAVESLFGIAPDEDGEVTGKGPRVDVNAVTRQLLVRGTRAEIERIRSLLEKMGESPGAELYAEDRGNVRMIPLSGLSATELMERVQSVWPTVGRNRIRSVTPSAAIEAMKIDASREDGAPSAGANRGSLPPGVDPGLLRPRPAGVRPAPVLPAVIKAEPASAYLPTKNRTYLLAQAADELPLVVGEPEQSRSAQTIQSVRPNRPGADIIVAPGPNGLLIASEDKEALDAFEELVRALSDPALQDDNDYTVFYLKYAESAVAADKLNSILGGGTDSGGGGFSGGLGALAGGMLPGFGGLFDSMMDSGSGGVTTSGPVQIVPIERLNALVVKGLPEDVELIRQLLVVIDQEHSPTDVQTAAPARLIPVFNARAADIAVVVKDVYASKLQASGNQGGGRGGGQPDLRAILGAMRGGRGGRGGGGRQQAEQKAPELTVSVDQRSNSLVVSAAEPLFEEIKALVRELDEAAIENNEITRVVQIGKANPETIQKALSSILGSGAPSSSSSNVGAAATGGQDSQRRAQGNEAAEQIRRRMDFFNAMQRAGRGGPGGGRGGTDASGGRGGGRGGGRDGRGGRNGGGRGGR